MPNKADTSSSAKYLDFRCYFEANGPNNTDSFSVKNTSTFEIDR